MSGSFSCPCDAPVSSPPANPPGLANIAYRDTDYVALRQALLTPLPGETQLTAWRPGAQGDLAVMMAEWWAYLGDIITFYNERIANEDYLGTAIRPASVRGLIGVLGYRPQPGIGATATLAALVQPGPTNGNTITLPAGLRVQSKPGPGQTPQVFELAQKTPIAAPDAVTATAPLALLAPDPSTLLLAGAVSGIFGGDYLLLRARDGSAGPYLLQVWASAGAVAITTLPGGAKQTSLGIWNYGSSVAGAASGYRLDKASQTASLWTLPGTAIDATGTIIQLSGLLRSVKLGDAVLLVNYGGAAVLTTISGLTDVVWDGNGSAPSKTSRALFPHTQITLANAIPTDWNAPNITLFYGWVEAATLVDQPVPFWPGPNAASPPQLIGATPFAKGDANNVLIADATGAGALASAATTGDLSTVAVTGLAPAAKLQTPVSVMFNLLTVTRGQTVAAEVLGSGDPATPNQSFQLAKSPLTYLRPTAELVSTLAITVNGQAWTEVANFLGQAANAPVFVTAQDSNQVTTVMFGDGVTGARLPAGTGNVVATYRFGSGLIAPLAGALTVIASPFPGLRALRNPVAATGGADPDPADQIQTFAPRSVLTFGRAVSALDYEAIAAGVAAGTRVAATWGWDPASQRGMATIYVADDAGILADVQKALAQSGDPNRPVKVVSATAVNVRLRMVVYIAVGADATTVGMAIRTALGDPVVGLFQNLGIGQSVFESQIAAVCQAVPGVVGLRDLGLDRSDRGWENATLHRVKEGSYFNLDLVADPQAIRLQVLVAGNG